MAVRADLASVAMESFGHVLRSTRGRLRQGRFHRRDYLINVPPRQASKYDAIYAYGRYPSGSRLPPIVWQDGPSDVPLLRKRGWSEKEVQAFTALKSEAMTNCNQCLVSSDYAAQVFAAQYPEHTSKLVVTPFLLPHVQALALNRVLEKHREGAVRLLFVGRQAYRKGLDVVLDAFARIRRSGVGDVSLDVVSAFDDGWRPQGDIAGVRYHGALPAPATMELMQRAHFLVMPSRVESYGIVYIEAMSQGAIPVAADREPQRSMLGNGSYGILAPLHAEDLASRLQAVIADQAGRLQLAQAALERFNSGFSVASVLRRYEDAFSAAGRSG